MKLAIKQPYLFPHLPYFQEISAVNKYILYSNLNFIKDGWINRNRFLVLNNGPSYFTVPLVHKSSFKKINRIGINNSYDWRNKILKSITYNYKKAPFFDETFQLVESIIMHATDLIWELAAESAVKISNYLDISTEIQTDISEYTELDMKLNNTNYCNEEIFKNLDIHTHERKVIRILYIALREKASIFINSISGQEIYNKNTFQEYDIEFKFLKSKPFTYEQSGSGFHPNLSIIDTLMYCGKEKTKELLNEYSVI